MSMNLTLEDNLLKGSDLKIKCEDKKYRIISIYDIANKESQIISDRYKLKSLKLISEDSLKVVDWSKVPVDTEVYVTYEDDILKNIWYSRHFAKYEHGRIYVWDEGYTSFTTEKCYSYQYTILASDDSQEDVKQKEELKSEDMYIKTLMATVNTLNNNIRDLYLESICKEEIIKELKDRLEVGKETSKIEDENNKRFIISIIRLLEDKGLHKLTSTEANILMKFRSSLNAYIEDNRG